MSQTDQRSQMPPRTRVTPAQPGKAPPGPRVHPRAMRIIKYPRTLHIEGSRLQPGDEDLGSATPFAHIAGRHLVVEEKMDGANSAISFDADGQLLLQSRGHYLTGGPRERHFALFKQWAGTLAGALWERLGSRYVMYGEWLYAKHTVFYDALPHYFMEFDILDRESRSGSAVSDRESRSGSAVADPEGEEARGAL